MRGSRIVKIGLACMAVCAFTCAVFDTALGASGVEILLTDLCGVVALGFAAIIDVLERMA